jgi:transcriptional regulator with XRE-family HTH domain
MKHNIIRQLRERAGLTQVELADRIKRGQSLISAFENAGPNSSPSPRSVFRVAAACVLDVTLTADGWIISEVGETHTPLRKTATPTVETTAACGYPLSGMD